MKWRGTITQPVADGKNDQTPVIALPPDITVEAPGEGLKITRHTAEQRGCGRMIALLVASSPLLCMAAVGYNLYTIILQTSWYRNLIGLGLGLGLILIVIIGIVYELLTNIVSDQLILIDHQTIKVRMGPWPSLFSRRTLSRDDLKQFYVSQDQVTPDKKPSYQLLAVAVDGQETELLTIPSSSEALYLAYRLEQHLQLVHEPISEEVGPLLAARAARFAAWQRLAQTHHLTFANHGPELWLSGRYRDCTVELKARPKDSLSDEQQIILRISTEATLVEEAAEQSLSPAQISQLLTRAETIDLTGRLTIDAAAQTLLYEADIIEPDRERELFLLERCYALLHAYPKIVAQGGAGMSTLQEILRLSETPFQPLVKQLLDDIATDTITRLSDPAQKFICPTCLARITAHTIDLNWLEAVTYYACRVCQQSQATLTVCQETIAVLDQGMTVPYEQQQTAYLRVNWLQQQRLFDFDAVDIVQATDAAVERFAVQVGNDTDEIRRPGYKSMDCSISANCQLSANTLRILQATFGAVKRYAPDDA